MKLNSLSVSFAAALAICFAGAMASPVQAQAQTQTPAQDPGQDKGEYIFNLAGCEGCHTDKDTKGPPLAGGRAFKTDFGTFYSPNITPDPETGIGNWTFDDFQRAMHEGLSPDGSHYFPAFPYTSYTHMTDADLKSLWSYLSTRPAITAPSREHDVMAPFSWRWTVLFWKLLYFDKGPRPDWSRGRYVTEALAHCQECHTPRNILGGYDNDRKFAGTASNPEGLTIPNITPDPETGIGKWTEGDFNMLFTIGMLPDGDFVGGVMGESVSHSTSKMTPEDRAAMIKYLQSLAPIHNQVERKKTNETKEQGW